MGNVQGAGADAANFHEPLQALLRQRDLKISAGTIWRLVRSSLRDDCHHDIIRAGRRVLMQHQDSLVLLGGCVPSF